jgi:iron complex transport system ATP-binding protein
MVAPVIELDQVGFRYGPSGPAVLDAVDLAIGGGTLVCLVGPNGAGKTTLLRLCGGLAAPTSGAVRVLGVDPAREPRRRMARRLSYTPQGYRLAFPYRVSEVVLMGRYAHGSGSPFALEGADDLAAAAAAMERCDVAGLAARRFDELSGGEQRRVLLAQAFCQGAELLLLDEPTASLDPAHSLALFSALAAERDRRGATALVVTHDLNLAARMADRLVLIAGGRIAADGAPVDVLRSPATAAAFEVAMHVGSLPGSGAPFAVPS